MSKLLILILFVVFLSAPLLVSMRPGDEELLRKIVGQYGQAEVSIIDPGKDALETLTKNVSVTSARDGLIYLSISPLTLDWFINSGYNYKVRERTDIKGVAAAFSTVEALEWQKYPAYSQYDSIVNYFAVTYPDLCDPDTIGTSINGKYIFALKISDKAHTDEDEPEVFFSSTIHGDETGGYILMLRLIDYLLKNYGSDNRVKDMVDNLEIWINPLANPDGTYNSGDIISSPVRFNANGYDLNRNFPDPVTPNTIKQKETLDMIRFMRMHRFILSANFHSGSEVVNYPWDRWFTRYHADDLWFREISRAYADTVHKYSGPAYMTDQQNGITRGADWYIIYGGRQDFVTYELHGREVTIELDVNKMTAPSQLELLWQNNYRSMLRYLSNALYGIHGLVRDSNSGEAVPARIFIKGHDKDSSHVYSDTLTGRFERLLLPGLWDLTFSADGYRDTTITRVIVSRFEKTELIVEMEPEITGIDTNLSGIPVLYPNPSSSLIYSILPSTFSGYINVKIFSMSGRKLSDYNTESAPGVPVIIDGNKLPAGVCIAVFTHIKSGTRCSGRFIMTSRF